MIVPSCLYARGYNALSVGSVWTSVKCRCSCGAVDGVVVDTDAFRYQDDVSVTKTLSYLSNVCDELTEEFLTAINWNDNR